MNSAENILPATLYQQKIHTAAPDVEEQPPLKGKKGNAIKNKERIIEDCHAASNLRFPL